MKTPKEEAEALVEKMRKSLYESNGYSSGSINCAIIAVEAILDAIDWHDFETPNKQIDHWQQVLNHLKQM